MLKLSGKQTVVIGAARSGVASAMLLLRQGALVTINDCRPLAELARELEMPVSNEALRIVGGGHPAEIVNEDVVLVVKSPGIPDSLPPLVRAKELGIPVIAEVEMAYWQLACPLVAITGTNGKTTTTALTGEMYRAAGKKTAVAGNIGLPLSAVVLAGERPEVVVAELSSFQLEGTATFRPQLAAILNITPDHLDRHGSMAAYREAKARIFANQGPAEMLVINADDPEAYALREQPVSQVYLFSRRQEVARGAFLRNGFLVLRDGEREAVLLHQQEICIPGAHNLENALAASLLAWLGGIEAEIIADVLRRFPGVPHRLESLGSVSGVHFVNDSKGTNIDAALKALTALPEKKVLIAGGYDKGADFTLFAAAVKEHVSHVVVIGQVAKRLTAAFDQAGFAAYTFAATLEEAVSIAYRQAQPGEAVLLSPACASWDMFSSFEERGERFKKAVRELGG
ncbi:MAG: UDP-N-acetylmuramoyl-L-alanine--D-glutamate ligase [Dethiobacter sp.]|nr:UDP-N-acetylmuramoyl-L-alanine--D-glutamate ligase [Dethiobacter sp.]MBS3900254.1 UDP-N-acetylmuramoyl-L-alanine--D-glutamate ligase [Dethiobacter sp.]MBS3983490.1 UDP-N-acetylmuramoyl-L-alanine--D-glutamate ligase [Dethiobacter sp.]MCL4463958.1 UDP-N-acetylmuramoyl-L-alanine--D-glutamate ligase [Bacillota bacterium]MCL5992805.1 UDP-N-acetylmuramoyl-L-alanine--D-glutamate ligase [Bacillota bacterium]